MVTSDIERIFREEYGRAVSVLVRVCGDIDTALRLGGLVGPDGKKQVRHLHEMVLKRGYLAARARLGVGAVK